MKKILEKKDLNRKSSLYLTNLMNKKSAETNLQQLENEDVYFENVYYEEKKPELIELDPGFSKSQKYIDVLYTVDSDESVDKVYDDKRYYFYQYLREKETFQTGYEHKYKNYGLENVEEKKKNFDYKAKENKMEFMLKKQIKDSKKIKYKDQKDPLSNAKFKKNVQNQRSKSFCKTFINSCIKRLDEDRENLKKKMIEDLRGK